MPNHELTDREKQVLALIHLPDSEISERLSVSAKTVTTVMQKIFDKLCFDNRNRVEAGFRALAAGLISNPFET